MECSICLEVFSMEERRPKVLPCGHSFCLPCLRQLQAKECPVDRKKFRAVVDNLPDNRTLLGLHEQQQQQLQQLVQEQVQQQLQQVQQASGHRLWCRDCSKEADDACVDEHSVCSLKKARADRAAPRLAALDADEAALRGISAELNGAADGLEAELARCRGRLVAQLDALDCARQQLEATAEVDEAVFQEATEANGQDGLPRDAALVLPALGDAASACSVSLQGPDGVSWTASVAHCQRPFARLLLCQLLCDDQLHRQGQQQASLNNGEVKAEEVQGWEERSNAVELDNATMAWWMRKDSRVTRGSDWPEGCTDDGELPRSGTVVEKAGCRVTVQWDCGVSGTYRMGVKRAGEGPIYELKLLPARYSLLMIDGVKKDTPQFLEVHTVSSGQDVKKKADLLSSETIDEVLALVNLRCDVSPAWSKEVLRRVAPRLKAVLLLQPDAEHLRLVQAMPNLTTLFLSPVTRELLQTALAMPGLRHLEAHCPFESPLLGALQLPQESRLESLRLGVYPLRAAIAVVRSQAATLKKLCLVAASREPYGCPDLAAELRDCGLSALKFLRLWRQSSIEFCQHDVGSCREQKARLFDMFLETRLTVEVKCKTCD